MKRTRPTISIVLDTSCVRGIPRATVAALLRRGFQLQVSALALDELAVHLARPPIDDADTKNQRTLRSRMQFFSELFQGAPPIAPTHSALINKLGGCMRGMPSVSYPDWLRDMRNAWTCLAAGGPLSADIARYVDGIAAYVDDTGADFVATSGAVAAFGEPSNEDLQLAKRLSRFLGGPLDYIQLPAGISKVERFDAHRRLLDRHTFTAHSRAIQLKAAHTPNDAIDVNLMQHLAEGLIVATRDYKLIENVDACGTPQAPWVRTVGELLAGRMPSGPPFAYNAKRAMAKHRSRTHTELRRFDAEGDNLARSEDGRSQSSARIEECRDETGRIGH